MSYIVWVEKKGSEIKFVSLSDILLIAFTVTLQFVSDKLALGGALNAMTAPQNVMARKNPQFLKERKMTKRS